MALRLAGEDYSVVRGLDGLGWLRDVVVSSADPALKVDQKGSGSILDLLDNGTPVLRVLNGGNLGFLVGKALAAGQYEIGRNADATNRLQYNVPTGSLHEFSANGVSILEIASNQVEIKTGQLTMDGVPIALSGDTTPQATGYHLARRTTGGSLIAYNVPTGAAHRFSINDVQKLLLDATGLTLADALEIDGDLNHDGSSVGLYGVTPVAQAAKINDPSGGATIDAEARTAINSIIDALEGIGITSAA